MNNTNWKLRLLIIALGGIIGSTCMLSACAADWQKNVRRHGMSFERLRRAENGTITGYSETVLVYQGVTCTPGWVRFYADWQLKSCVLGESLEKAGNIIPANSWVKFGQTGDVVSVAFPENIRIQGHECIGTIGDPTKGVHTAFYPGGQLKYFYAPTSVEIFGISCRGGRFFSGIGLHDNGHVQTCILADAITLDGTIYHQGQRITLTPDGTVVESLQ